jgi:hypothetical protein
LTLVILGLAAGPIILLLVTLSAFHATEKSAARRARFKTLLGIARNRTDGTAEQRATRRAANYAALLFWRCGRCLRHRHRIETGPIARIPLALEFVLILLVLALTLIRKYEQFLSLSERSQSQEHYQAREFAHSWLLKNKRMAMIQFAWKSVDLARIEKGTVTAPE